MSAHILLRLAIRDDGRVDGLTGWVMDDDIEGAAKPAGGSVHLELEGRRRVEVISGVERRRRWSRTEKAQITRESFMPGVSVSDVARRHGMSLGLLHHWRRAARDAGDVGQSFVPVLPAEEPSAPLGGGLIQIEVGGASIRLHGSVDNLTLRTVLNAVRGA